MANQHGFEYLGELALGDDLPFLMRLEDYSFTPEFIDVRNAVTGALVRQDLAVSPMTVATSAITDGLVKLDAAMALTELNGFAEGKSYRIVVKDATGQSIDGSSFELGPTFSIGRQNTISTDTGHIYRTDRSDGLVSAVPNSVLGRLYTLELANNLNLGPKLRRVLAYLGENQVVDGFFFDNASNVVRCRIRGYDTEDNARAAFRWVNTEDDSDPVGAYPTTGELFRCWTLASHSNPRQLRTELLGSLSPEDGGSGDASDQQYDDTSPL